MPWKETCPMEERMKFIADYLQDEWSLALSGPTGSLAGLVSKAVENHLISG